MSLAALAVLAASVSGGGSPQFVDVTVAAGVDYLQGDAAQYGGERPFMTGGAAAGDYDGDGWVDLFVTRLGEGDILFRNLGESGGTHLGFQDVTGTAFEHMTRADSNGAAWADIENDGDLDLYVTSLFGFVYRLYVNDGNGLLQERGAERFANMFTNDVHSGWSVAFGDYDRDGFLDFYATEWGNNAEPSHSRLMRNLGEGQPGYFEDVTEAAGVSIDHLIGSGPATKLFGVYSFAPVFSDLDADGHPDLLLASDFGTSRLFWNRGGQLGFDDGTEAAHLGTDENGMGITVGDYDQDGRLDVFVTSIFDPADTCGDGSCNWGPTGNRLFRNEGGRVFVDATDAAGVRDGGWGWGTTFWDYDNDADLDLVMTNGVVFDSSLEDPFNDDPMRLWRNDGGAFTELAAASGITDTRSGKGLLCFDYDRDGDLDLFVVNNFDHPVLYRNDGGNANDWLQLELCGRESNRSGIGARVEVRSPGLPRQVRELRAGNNFLGQNEDLLHFGLGSGTGAVDEVVIRWPSGRVQRLSDVPRNTRLCVIEPGRRPLPGSTRHAETPSSAPQVPPGVQVR